MRLRFTYGLLVAAMAVTLVGCGGNGSDGPKIIDQARVPIAWASGVDGVKATNASQSVSIQLVGAGANHSDVFAYDNRPPTVTQTNATATTQSFVGTYTLRAVFYESGSQTGHVVATASATVMLDSDGLIKDTNGQPLHLTSTPVP